MLLVDSNVIIDFWRDQDPDDTETFRNEIIAVCGVVRAELIHGALSERDIDITIEALSEFKNLEWEESDWGKLGKMLYRLRKSGVTVPFSDAIIAFLAIKYNVPVWTKDKHFRLIQEIVPELRLYNRNTI